MQTETRSNVRFQRAADETVDWLTPRFIIDSLGPFDMDPCAADPRPWPTAKVHFTKADNGLAQTWKGRVWLNPPYGEDIFTWISRLAGHGQGTALVFARTDTEWWHRYVFPVAHALVFCRGRVQFIRNDGKEFTGRYRSPSPSVLIAYGSGDAERLCDAIQRSRINGNFVPLK